MAKINAIDINGFKAFPSKFELELKGKHLLMYGENGSGKSSIYYALHCLFNSFRKPDKGKKYFDRNNPQNLINRNFKPKDAKDKPYVAVNWQDGARTPFLSAITDEGCQDFDRLPELETYFINHQLLFDFFNFANSKSINLFPVFQRDFLPYEYIDESGTYLSLMYEQIIEEASKLGNKSSSKNINEMIDAYNYEIDRFIGDINLNVSDIYNNCFRSEGDPSLQIILLYPEVNPNPDTIFNGYRLKWDYPLIKLSGGLVKAPNKTIIEPIIGISINNREGGEPINKPHTDLNEAKLTAIALSIRLALLNLENPAEGSFFALDDMLISLDMSNRVKIVDFLLGISDKYKIYLFTHDRAFFEYFKHKSKRHSQPGEWLYKEIYMDDNKEPYIRNSDSYIEEAEHYIKKHKYEIAGNFLRKAAESFCKSFLPLKKQFSADYSRLDLNGMIVNSKDFAIASGMTSIQLFDELDEHRKFILNPSSHDSYDVEKYPHELKRCLNTLKKIEKINIRPFMKRGAKLEFTLKTPAPKIDEYKFEIVLCDDFKVVEQPGEEPIITKGMINYKVSKNGNEGETQSDNTTLKRFYEVNYNQSDKANPSLYLDGIKEVETNNLLRTIVRI